MAPLGEPGISNSTDGMTRPGVDTVVSVDLAPTHRWRSHACCACLTTVLDLSKSHAHYHHCVTLSPKGAVLRASRLRCGSRG